MNADQFLTAWLASDGDPLDLLNQLGVTPTRLLELLHEHRDAIDAFDALKRRRLQLRALEHQAASADQLRRLLPHAADHAHRRQLAVALGRIANQIQRARATPLPPSRGAQAPGLPLPHSLPHSQAHSLPAPTPPQAPAVAHPAPAAPRSATPGIATKRPCSPAALLESVGAHHARAG